jgi:hypothetical protein
MRIGACWRMYLGQRLRNFMISTVYNLQLHLKTSLMFAKYQLRPSTKNTAD